MFTTLACCRAAGVLQLWWHLVRCVAPLQLGCSRLQDHRSHAGRLQQVTRTRHICMTHDAGLAAGCCCWLLVLSPVAVSGWWRLVVGGAEEMVDTLDYITVPATAAAAAAAALQTQPFKWKFRKIWSLGWAGLGWAGLAGWCRQQRTKVQPSQGAGPWNISRHRAHWILDHTEVAVPGLYHSPP